MTTSEKNFDQMFSIGKRGNYMRLTTNRDEVMLCEILDVADEGVDEDDSTNLAWHIRTIEVEPRYYTMPCDYVKSIEEVSWQEIGKPNSVFAEAHPNYVNKALQES